MRIVDGDAFDPATVAEIGNVDGVFMFNLLLHTVAPDWDRVLELYAPTTRCLVIANPQWQEGEQTVRLIDLGRERFLEAVPASERHRPPVRPARRMALGGRSAASRCDEHLAVGHHRRRAHREAGGARVPARLRPPSRPVPRRRRVREQDLRFQAMSRLRCLGVLLCYNDGDLLEESISYLLEQDHDVIAWDHGSTDETPAVLRRFGSELREHRNVPRDFDFYELYPEMSRHLMSRLRRRVRLDLVARPGRVSRGAVPRSSLPRLPARSPRRRRRLDRVRQLQLLVHGGGRPGRGLDHAASSTVRALPRLPAPDPLLARIGHEHPPLQPQPSRRNPVAAPLQAPALPDALPGAGASSCPARPRRAASRRHELPLREHEAPAGFARDSGRCSCTWTTASADLDPKPIFEWRRIYGTAPEGD